MLKVSKTKVAQQRKLGREVKAGKWQVPTKAVMLQRRVGVRAYLIVFSGLEMK